MLAGKLQGTQVTSLPPFVPHTVQTQQKPHLFVTITSFPLCHFLDASFGDL